MAKKTGLVLGSGAARGLAHIGAIKALREKKVKVDLVAGTSIGALVGACYAKNGNIKEIEKLVLKTDWVKLLGLADFNLAFMLKGFIHGQKVKQLLKPLLEDIKFKDLKIPLSVTTTDINTGEKVVIKKGTVLDAVRASISIPVVFSPVKLKRRYLADGGIVDPVPVDTAKKMGADFIIASNVIAAPHKRKRRKTTHKSLPAAGHKNALKKMNDLIDGFVKKNRDKYEDFNKLIENFNKKFPALDRKKDSDIINAPNIFDSLVHAIYTMEYEIAKKEIKKADIIIEPDVSHISSLEFYSAKKLIELGYKAAQKKNNFGG